MGRKVGLWVDHRKAVIVIITDTGEEAKLVISNFEKQLRRSGNSPVHRPYEAQQVRSDDNQEARLRGILKVYYDAVIACIRDADSILIFGPGEAKSELKKQIEKSNLSGRVFDVETTDKMTDPQIAAKVRQYYQKNGGW